MSRRDVVSFEAQSRGSDVLCPQLAPAPGVALTSLASRFPNESNIFLSQAGDLKDRCLAMPWQERPGLDDPVLRGVVPLLKEKPGNDAHGDHSER